MLRAPFPWFGGKSRVAHLVWDRFGDVPNYVEPFAGSLAVLLSRPTEPGTETVNDLDTYLANFWRAVQADPVEVALWAGWPVNECDLHARHRWLVGIGPDFHERMKADPSSSTRRWPAGGRGAWRHGSERAGVGHAGMGLHRNSSRTSGTRGWASIGSSRTSGTREGHARLDARPCRPAPPRARSLRGLDAHPRPERHGQARHHRRLP